MVLIYGRALVKINKRFVLKASNGKYYKKWDSKQKRSQPLDKQKLKEFKIRKSVRRLL